MAYSALTQEGKKFIKSACGTGNDKLQGKRKNPLPFSDTLATKIWEASPTYLGKTVTTNQTYADALIYWFDKYAKEYELNANYIAAQAYQESAYNTWTYYDGDATSSGISQFEMPSFYEIIVKSNYFPNVAPLTSNEIAKLTNGLTYKNEERGYQPRMNKNADYTVARENRPIWHQNVIDNPDLMIKAQCRYMKYLANGCNSLASSSLFCYNRGSGFMSKTYKNTIKKAINWSGNKDGKYQDTGIDYVYKIFKSLYYNFGYKHLNMDKDPNTEFDEFAADTAEANLMGYK